MATVKFPEPSGAVRDWLQKQGMATHVHWEMAGKAGSGRGYYRVRLGERSFVLQQSGPDDKDFNRFVEYGRLLHSESLPVPEIFAVSDTVYQVLMEDLGSCRLWDTVVGPGDQLGRAAYWYPRVLAALVQWQEASERVFASHPELAARSFDLAALEWETAYFKDNYLQAHCGIESIPDDVTMFFQSLAHATNAHPRVLMHRDFQSQNIMVVPPEHRIALVDFQGARRGSVYYDVASLLWDPYTALPAGLVKDLFGLWVRSNPLLANVDFADAWKCFLVASLQRLMQALGAYCFLSRVKGIASFASYIAPGRTRLQEVLALYAQSVGPVPSTLLHS
jgi:N-acetylmuramate 1-kinase